MGKRTRGKSEQPPDFPSCTTRTLIGAVADGGEKRGREVRSEEVEKRERAAATALYATHLHGETNFTEGKVATTNEARQTTPEEKEEKQEEPEQPVSPSTDNSTPSEGGDFAGADVSAEKGNSGPMQTRGTSPPGDLGKPAQGESTVARETDGEARLEEDLVAKHIDESHAKQREYYNRGNRVVEYAVGDRVMRRVHTLSNAAQGFSAKFAPRYEGPYEIIVKLSPTVYLLEMDGSRRNNKVHVGELKRYLPPRRVANDL